MALVFNGEIYNFRDLQKLYTPAFRAALGKARAEEPMLDYLADLPCQNDRLERLLSLEQRFFLTDYNLIYTDKMAMAAGVEVRVPFLDLDLVNFLAQIPTRFKQGAFQGKWVLKKAMEPYLPREVIYRPKSGFGAPQRQWLRVELRDWLSEILSKKRLEHRGLFNSTAVHPLISEKSESLIDASYTFLSFVCIELWCKYFINNESTPVSIQLNL